jgi:hypothetical protein
MASRPTRDSFQDHGRRDFEARAAPQGVNAGRERGIHAPVMPWKSPQGREQSRPLLYAPAGGRVSRQRANGGRLQFGPISGPRRLHND